MQINKKKCAILLIIFMYSTGPLANAETVYLKDGTTVKGKIVDQKSYYIVVQQDNYPKKIFRDQIARIEKDPTGDQAKKVTVDPAKFPEISPEKIHLVGSLMEFNGTYRNMEENFKWIVDQAPLERREELQKLLDIVQIGELLIPIYNKYFSEEELKELVEFYKTPAGKKMVEVMPSILKETAEASVRYFQEKAQ